MNLPKTAWMVAAGAGVFFGAPITIKDPKARVALQAGGAILAGLGIVLGFDDLLTFFNIQPRPKVTESSTETIADIQKGAAGATGIITGQILRPYSGAHVDRAGVFGNVYPVRLSLSSSLEEDKRVSVVLISQEFYSLGGDAEITFDAGVWLVGAGKVTTFTVNMEIADPGLTLENPFYPVEVALEMRIDSRVTDSVRFTRS